MSTDKEAIRAWALDSAKHLNEVITGRTWPGDIEDQADEPRDDSTTRE